MLFAWRIARALGGVAVRRAGVLALLFARLVAAVATDDAGQIAASALVRHWPRAVVLTSCGVAGTPAAGTLPRGA